jgi:hypothetical protein
MKSKTLTKKNIEKIENSTIRCSYSYRGGGIEISLKDYGYPDEKMSAYQNYLGGGMLAKIQNDCTIHNWESKSKLLKIAENLSRYFHSLTNHEGDEWESATFEENQLRPSRSY